MLDVILALLTVLGFVIAALHLAAYLLDRGKPRSSRGPDRVSPTVSPSPAEPPTIDGREHEALHVEPEPDRQSEVARGAVAWRAGLAYLFGFIGAIVFWRNRRFEVRFHAAQSLLIDASALLYVVIACLGLLGYLMIRYPGTEQEVPSGDPGIAAFMTVVFVVPPVLHLLFSVLAFLGRQPRMPIIWRIAASLAARPKPK